MEKPVSKFRRFYHIEYFLLPDDREPKKVDIVVFPAVVKVFLDSGVKVCVCVALYIPYSLIIHEVCLLFLEIARNAEPWAPPQTY